MQLVKSVGYLNAVHIRIAEPAVLIGSGSRKKGRIRIRSEQKYSESV